MEDEISFPFPLLKYSMIRDNFYNKVQTSIPNIRQLPVNEHTDHRTNELFQLFYLFTIN